MIRIISVAASLALGLALAATTSLASAKSRAVHPGYNARAEAADGEFGGPAGNRVNALRECNEKAGKFSQSTWGNMPAQQYRTCMAEHGEVE